MLIKCRKKEKEGNTRGAKEREKLYRHNRFSSEGIRRFRYICIYIGIARERKGEVRSVDRRKKKRTKI